MRTELNMLSKIRTELNRVKPTHLN